jgi:hypothetical protein
MLLAKIFGIIQGERLSDISQNLSALSAFPSFSAGLGARPWLNLSKFRQARIFPVSDIPVIHPSTLTFYTNND